MNATNQQLHAEACRALMLVADKLASVRPTVGNCAGSVMAYRAKFDQWTATVAAVESLARQRGRVEEFHARAYAKDRVRP